MKRRNPLLLAGFAWIWISGSAHSEEPARLPATLKAGVVLDLDVERLIERTLQEGEVLDVRGGRTVEKDTKEPARVRSFRVESRIEYRVEVLEANARETLIAVSVPKVVAEGVYEGIQDRFDSTRPAAADESGNHATLRWYASRTQRLSLAPDGVLTPIERERPPAELAGRARGRNDGTVGIDDVLGPWLLTSDLYVILGSGLRGAPLRSGESYRPMELGLERGEPEERVSKDKSVKVVAGGRRLATLTFDRSTPRGAEFTVLATPGTTLYRPSMASPGRGAAPARAGTAVYGLDGFVEEYRLEVRREREAAGVAGPFKAHDALRIRRRR